MDETRTHWFRWVADNAKNLFWGIWGGGVGTFAAIFFKAVDAGGDVLRIYLAILTAMMGGTLALATSRAMDHLVDERKRRRKVGTARLRILALQAKWEDLQRMAEELTDSGSITTFDTVTLPEAETIRCSAQVETMRNVATRPPDFDEIVETEEDLRYARLVELIFNYTLDYFDKSSWSIEAPDNIRRAVVVEFLMSRAIANQTIRSLASADAHFARVVARR